MVDFRITWTLPMHNQPPKSRNTHTVSHSSRLNEPSID